MNSSDMMAIATGALALFTAWMVWETRKIRLETMRREGEVAFRAALAELATNLQHLKGWNPFLEPTAPENWPQRPLAFAALKDLLARMWIPGV